MTLEDKDVLMLHQFHRPHPAHEVFGDAVGAEYAHFETGEPIGGDEANLDSMVARLETAVTLDEYDVVIGEGSTPIYTLLFYKAFNNVSASVVPLIADETFQKIRQQKTHYLWKTVLARVANTALAGGIAVSELSRSWARQYLDVPFEIVHPNIDETKYDLLYGVKDSYDIPDVPTILHAGTVSDNAAVAKKNVDLLAGTVSKRDDWQLRLVGSGHDDYEYVDHQNVHATGYIEELSAFADEFAAADAYVQASSGDAFPVASLEAMLAGVPTVVTTSTGTREVVGQVDPNLVCEPTREGILNAMSYALSLDPSEREARADEMQSIVAQFTTDRQAEEFKGSLENIVS